MKKLFLISVVQLSMSVCFMTGCDTGSGDDSLLPLLLLVNSNKNSADWSTSANTFINPRDGHACVVNNGYLYVIGGSNDSMECYNDVKFAAINSDGTLGAFNDTSSFTTARTGHASVVNNGYLYVIGGMSETMTYLNDVQFAKINADGTLESFSTAGTFTTGRWDQSSVVYNGYLYVIGGFNPTATGSFLNDVQYAKINSNGTLEAFTGTSSFTTARYAHTSVAYNGHVYVIGGLYCDSFLNDVQYAAINLDGTLGTFTGIGSFPDPRYGHTSVINNGYLYIIGGFANHKPVYLNDIRSAEINTDGTLGSFANAGSFKIPRGNHSSVVNNGYLYIIGGNQNNTPSAINDIQIGQFVIY